MRFNKGYVLFTTLILFSGFTLIFSKLLYDYQIYTSLKKYFEIIDTNNEIEKHLFACVRAKQSVCEYNTKSLQAKAIYDENKLKISFEGERRKTLEYDIMKDESFKLIHMEE